jgi:hypothetical protein
LAPPTRQRASKAEPPHPAPSGGRVRHATVRQESSGNRSRQEPGERGYRPPRNEIGRLPLTTGLAPPLAVTNPATATGPTAGRGVINGRAGPTHPPRGATRWDGCEPGDYPPQLALNLSSRMATTQPGTPAPRPGFCAPAAQPRWPRPQSARQRRVRRLGVEVSNPPVGDDFMRSRARRRRLPEGTTGTAS